MTGTGDIGRVWAPDDTQTTAVALNVTLRPVGVMSDYEVERALIRRIESMSGDEARQWLVRMGQDGRDV